MPRWLLPVSGPERGGSRGVFPRPRRPRVSALQADLPQRQDLPGAPQVARARQTVPGQNLGLGRVGGGACAWNGSLTTGRRGRD